MREGVFLGLFLDLDVAAEFSGGADLYEDEGALSLVERDRVCGGRVRDSSCVYEVRCGAMTGSEQCLSLLRRKDPF